MEKPDREGDVEGVIREGEPGGVAAHELDGVGDAGGTGLLAGLAEHRPGDVDPGHVRAALGEHDREPAGTTRDLDDPLVLEGGDGVQHGRLFPAVDEAAAAGEALVLVGLRDGVGLVPFPSFHGPSYRRG